MACSSYNYKNDPFFKEATFCWLTTDQSDCILKVRDQGFTDSCYAFVLADVIHAVSYLNGDDEPLHCSEQEVFDHLHKSYGSSKYTGSDMVIGRKGLFNSFMNAFKYVTEKGVATAVDYPFVGEYQGFQDLAPTSGSKIFIEGFEIIDDGDHDLVIQVLEKKHPVTGSIVIGKSFWEWKPKKGVYTGPTPEEQISQVDKTGNKPSVGRHGIFLIGYGTEDGKDYYLCKNSFGVDWGHKGCFRVLRQLVRHFYYPISPKLKEVKMKRKRN